MAKGHVEGLWLWCWEITHSHSLEHLISTTMLWKWKWQYQTKDWDRKRYCQDKSDHDQSFLFANDKWRYTQISSDLQCRWSELTCSRRCHLHCWVNKRVSDIVFQDDRSKSRQVPTVLASVKATTTVSNNIITNELAKLTESGKSIRMSMNHWHILPLMHWQCFVYHQSMISVGNRLHAHLKRGPSVKLLGLQLFKITNGWYRCRSCRL